MTRGKLPIALFAAAALGLTACATAEGYRQQTSLWIGAPSDSLLIDYGAPVQRERLSDGREVWVYYVQNHHYSEGYTTDEPRERRVRSVDSDGKVTEFVETYYVPIFHPPSEYWTECETRFVIGLTGLVEDFRFNGTACVAEEIY